MFDKSDKSVQTEKSLFNGVAWIELFKLIQAVKMQMANRLTRFTNFWMQALMISLFLCISFQSIISE